MNAPITTPAVTDCPDTHSCYGGDDVCDCSCLPCRAARGELHYEEQLARELRDELDGELFRREQEASPTGLRYDAAQHLSNARGLQSTAAKLEQLVIALCARAERAEVALETERGRGERLAAEIASTLEQERQRVEALQGQLRAERERAERAETAARLNAATLTETIAAHKAQLNAVYEELRAAKRELAGKPQLKAVR